jgi:hypothetical protein
MNMAAAITCQGRVLLLAFNKMAAPLPAHCQLFTPRIPGEN